MKVRTIALLWVSVFGIAATSRAQDDIDPDAGPHYEVTQKAMVAGWTVSSFSMNGKLRHGMMERSYDNGTLFRYFVGNDVSSFMFFDGGVWQALPDGVDGKMASYWFTGGPNGDTPPIESSVSTDNHLTSEQDAMVTVDVRETTDFLASMIDSKALHVKIGGYQATFEMKGAQKAADELLDVTNPPMEEEKIIMEKGTPSVVWDLELPAGESKVYQIEGKKGQTMKLGYIEDTGEGMVDLGKASVEQGPDTPATIVFESDRMQRVDVCNPSGKKMDFRIFLSVE